MYYYLYYSVIVSDSLEIRFQKHTMITIMSSSWDFNTCSISVKYSLNMNAKLSSGARGLTDQDPQYFPLSVKVHAYNWNTEG